MSKWVGKWKKKPSPYGWIGVVYMNGIPIRAMYESEFDLLMSRLNHKNITCVGQVKKK